MKRRFVQDPQDGTMSTLGNQIWAVLTYSLFTLLLFSQVGVRAADVLKLYQYHDMRQDMALDLGFCLCLFILWYGISVVFSSNQ